MNFQEEVNSRVNENNASKPLRDSASAFMRESLKAGYSYNFTWLGVPVIQYPQDIVAIQEVIWKVKPDLIIETGVARGGSLLLSASIMSMYTSQGKVLGIDIDIRDHAKSAISESHLTGRIDLIQGSSTDDKIVKQVIEYSKKFKNIMIILDSNHTEDHVLRELNAYAHLVTSGSYCLVFDSVVEFYPDETSVNRPWGKGDNPYTAIHKFLAKNSDFNIDKFYQNQTLISVAPDGFLVRK